MGPLRWAFRVWASGFRGFMGGGLGWRVEGQVSRGLERSGDSRGLRGLRVLSV